MTDESELIKKRILELARRSEASGTFTFTDFLGLSEQTALSELTRELSGITRTAFGGAEGTERVIIRFGSPDELYYEEPFPISVIRIAPLSEQFADRLTHRDFLGAILNLGIERSRLGDIAIINNVGYLFCKDEIADFIVSSLERVKHTDVKAEIIDSLPEGELFRTEKRRIQVSGERLDAVVARVFSLSREDAQSLFKKRLVFVSGRLTENTSYTPKENEVVSVRGHGRFIYRGYESSSKKGKLNLTVDVYI